MHSESYLEGRRCAWCNEWGEQVEPSDGDSFDDAQWDNSTHDEGGEG